MSIATAGTLPWTDRLELKLQQRFAQGMVPLTYYGVLAWMKLARRYRIPELRRTRRRFQRLLARCDGPVLVCANHLTLIDSCILIWAMGSGLRYLVRPSLFPWNLPEKRNFWEKFSMRAVCYAGKCLPIVRQGPREETQRTLAKVTHLLKAGEPIMIFPEGARSRTGRVDTENFAYGVGTILQGLPDARVLCVYLRGHEQTGHTDLPVRGETFHVRARLFRPRTESTGLRGARDIATQVITQLSRMERGYFEHTARHRQ